MTVISLTSGSVCIVGFQEMPFDRINKYIYELLRKLRKSKVLKFLTVDDSGSV